MIGNMKNVKKIVIITVISLIILFIVITCIVALILRSINLEDPYESDTPQDIEIEYPENSVKEDNDYMFFSINEYIQQLFDFIYESNAVAVYGLTDMEYINNNKINEENIISYFTNEKNRTYFYAQEIYKTSNENNSIYYIYGYKICSNELTDYYLKMKTDYNSYSFEPIPIEEFKNAKNGKEKRINEVKITSNEYNKYEMKYYTNREILQRYIMDYKVKIKYFPEEAYKLVSEENKKDKFPRIDDFYKYIKENEATINKMDVFDCDIAINDNYLEFKFKDFNNHEYKIDRSGILDYKISFLSN